jgi:Skp family chaperone for outer membrane proteins
VKTLLVTFVSISLAATALSCKEPSPTQKANEAGGTVAIVDLDKVFKEMGWGDEMRKNLQQTEAAINEQLQTALRPTQAALEAKRAEIARADKLTKEQTDQMATAKTRADLEKLGLTSKQIDEIGQAAGNVNNLTNSARQVMQQQLGLQREKIIQAYRQVLTPSIRRIAIANNKSVVLSPAQEIVLYSDAASNLSDQVVDDLQRSNIGKVELPPIPTPQSPQTGPATGPTTKPG